MRTTVLLILSMYHVYLSGTQVSYSTETHLLRTMHLASTLDVRREQRM